MRNLIGTLIVFVLHIAGNTQIIWDKTNYPLFPNVLHFEITSTGTNDLIGLQEVEIDYANGLVVKIDSTVKFDVKNLSSFGGLYVVMEKEPKVKKSKYIMAPMSEQNKMQELFRQIMFKDMHLNEVEVELRRGVIYTKDKNTKKLEKKYSDKEIKGKLLWIGTKTITIIEEDGTFLTLNEFQIERIVVNKVSYKSVNLAYDAFFEGYTEHVESLNKQIIDELKNSTFNELIGQLGAYSEVNIITGKTFVNWKYLIESYNVDLSNRSLTSSATTAVSHGNATVNSSSNANVTSTGAYSPSFRSAYVRSYYNNNRQSTANASSFMSSSTISSTASATKGQISKYTDELSMVIELSNDGKVVNVMQNGILTKPVYGLAFRFY